MIHVSWMRTPQLHSSCHFRPTFMVKSNILFCNEPDDSKLKQVIVYLGRFHTMMNYLVCIGYFMANSCLRKFWKWYMVTIPLLMFGMKKRMLVLLADTIWHSRCLLGYSFEKRTLHHLQATTMFSTLIFKWHWNYLFEWWTSASHKVKFWTIRSYVKLQREPRTQTIRIDRCRLPWTYPWLQYSDDCWCTSRSRLYSLTVDVGTQQP